MATTTTTPTKKLTWLITGCSTVFAPVETAEEDDERMMMETMYFGPLRLVRAVLEGMRRRRSGTVVHLSSGAALEGNFMMGGYAGAKAGLDGVSKVLAKEVAPFAIRILTVVLGTFDTNFLNAAVLGKKPIPDDYKNTAVGQVLPYFDGRKALPPNGDKEKAMKAVYEVVVGEGVGAGREEERFLLLGSDMVARAKLARDYFEHGLEVFGEVAESVKRVEG